ncbi:hypothetical protein WEB32_28005 [Streptomyces netropsis]|uniref:hypothetical protein n=1 Tax=Streptomyces netropsis TaxID=55404 RepID=UPI0030CCBA98
MAARQLPPLPQYRVDAVTRRMCATTHIDEDFTDEVLFEFTADRLKAVGLPLGINLVALVRHALAARGRAAARDRTLSLLLAGAGVSVVGTSVSLGNGSTAAAVGFLLALFAVVVAAWVVACRAVFQARRAALDVYRGTAEPEKLAPPAPPETEAYLKALRRANVVPYDAEAESANPFVGSGRKIKEVVWAPIDVGRPADSPTGGKLTIKPFDAVSLHTYVAKEMANIVGLERLRAQNRLYIRGLNVPHLGADLLPDPLKRPLPRIPPALVQSAVVRSGAGMRAYLSLEMVGEGGNVVVSMHLRARLLDPRLSWEVAAYVLPPTKHRFHAVAYLPLGGFEQWWAVVRQPSSNPLRAMWGAPGRARHRRMTRHQHERALEKARRQITKYHAAYDYGAFDSLRERTSDWDAMGHSERTDAQDIFQRLQQGVLIATERFLRDHNVDTGDFDRAQQVITTQTYNISGDITGPSNFGNNGQINAYGQQQGAGHQQGGGSHP